ncbi:hypothetical protein BKA70DRAFT_1233367 [Coprinopsis sp. MPI-PUGE-AT-0042]|nr:hypothetical protein BKA70DRAFT_1233367 [Coprinopsis sp. MPI-PUGE-AT-0042]
MNECPKITAGATESGEHPGGKDTERHWKAPRTGRTNRERGSMRLRHEHKSQPTATQQKETVKTPQTAVALTPHRAPQPSLVQDARSPGTQEASTGYSSAVDQGELDGCHSKPLSEHLHLAVGPVPERVRSGHDGGEWKREPGGEEGVVIREVDWDVVNIVLALRSFVGVLWKGAPRGEAKTARSCSICSCDNVLTFRFRGRRVTHIASVVAADNPTAEAFLAWLGGMGCSSGCNPSLNGGIGMLGCF